MDMQDNIYSALNLAKKKSCDISSTRKTMANTRFRKNICNQEAHAVCTMWEPREQWNIIWQPSTDFKHLTIMNPLVFLYKNQYVQLLDMSRLRCKVQHSLKFWVHVLHRGDPCETCNVAKINHAKVLSLLDGHRWTEEKGKQGLPMPGSKNRRPPDARREA